MKTLKHLFTLILLACLSVPALAEISDPDGVFAEANSLYAAEDYEQAIAQFELLTDNGHASAAVYFNLGNAQFKAGDAGAAILSYTRAQMLAPGDPDIAANLRFVREFKEVPPPNRPWWQVLALQMQVDQWFWLTTAAFWIGLSAYLLMPLWRAPQMARGALTVVAGIACIFGLMGLGGYHFMANEVIILPAKTALRAAPTANSPGTEDARGGELARITEERGEFILVEVSGATPRSGWLTKDEIGRIWE